MKNRLSLNGFFEFSNQAIKEKVESFLEHDSAMEYVNV